MAKIYKYENGLVLGVHPCRITQLDGDITQDVFCVMAEGNGLSLVVCNPALGFSREDFSIQERLDKWMGELMQNPSHDQVEIIEV